MLKYLLTLNTFKKCSNQKLLNFMTNAYLFKVFRVLQLAISCALGVALFRSLLGRLNRNIR